MKAPVLPWLLATLLLAEGSSPDRRPQFTTEPPARLLWPATRGATAVCRASGHPTPEVHWVTTEGQVLTTIPGLRYGGGGRCLLLAPGVRSYFHICVLLHVIVICLTSSVGDMLSPSPGISGRSRAFPGVAGCSRACPGKPRRRRVTRSTRLVADNLVSNI
ncbi:hypothetical protein JYU34_012799 [Plutella xylostella]|uniref:Ig-like domain-containing protein n=1 Tax=Plutella xylostella TaxID=51655 RepID=A0ABQ7QDH2_PLUXY|nr:hypothetical protein JYU34_012799 [Plutella xylostella]